MADFEHAYEYMIRHEVINYHAPGQVWYSNHPADKGGATAWGITEATAREYGYTDSMDTMLEMDALKIYRRAFWKFGGVENQRIASKLFDAAVNMGVRRAVKMAQQALDFEDYDIDGFLGPVTEAAINAADPDAFLEQYAIEMETRYRRLVERDPSQAVFLKGWLRRAHELPEE